MENRSETIYHELIEQHNPGTLSNKVKLGEHIPLRFVVRDGSAIKGYGYIVNSLVSTSIDYCNSLLYNLTDSSNTHIQRVCTVQNRRVRFVCPKVLRHHHISTTFSALLYLPISQQTN